MRFTIIVAALIGAVAAAPSQSLEDRATVSSDCSPTGATAGNTICNNPAYTYVYESSFFFRDQFLSLVYTLLTFLDYAVATTSS